MKKVKDTLVYKERLVPKEGKGRYNLTIPTPYEFQ